MVKALDVAAYLIWKSAQDGTEMTHLKLQKLCYYAQGYALALYPEPVFEEEIEAWDIGPVVAELWHHYHKYQRESIPPPEDPPEVDLWIRKLLDEVSQRFGWMSLWDLRNHTYDEEPWREAWYSLDQCRTIDRKVMRDYFRGQVRGNRRASQPVSEKELRALFAKNGELRERLQLARERVKDAPWDKWE